MFCFFVFVGKTPPTKHLAQFCPLHSWPSMFVFLSPPERFRGEISMLELISKPRTKSGMWQVTGCLSGEILLPLPQQPNQPTVTSSASLGHPHKPTVSPTSSVHFPPNSVIPVYRRDERRNTSHKMGLTASSRLFCCFSHLVRECLVFLAA